MAGRPPKPTALKVLQGNPGKRKLPKGEPTPAVGCVPPPGLSKRARLVWDQIVPELIAQRVATTLDPWALGKLCEMEVDFRRRAMRGDAIATQARTLLSYYQQFGMTASARAKLALPAEKEKDPFEVFLGGKAAGDK